MTMRLDIVTNDAGEGVRREHARDLGAGVVIAIYRLAKLAQLHDLANQAFTRQLEQTHQIIGDYCLRSGSNVNVMFAQKAVFVAGQLLKGSRSTYEAATELGELFERLGGSELSIQRDITRQELFAFAEQISLSFREAVPSFASTAKIRLRAVADAARLRGLELEDLTPDQRIVRMYASAVVIMRRFFEDLEASRYFLPRRIKRIAQSLVDLSDGSTPAFLGVTEVRNANFDEAGRAANTAILAVSMAREVTSDRAILSQIAMAAMMHDVARPRAMALSQGAADPSMPGMQGPTSLSEDQEDRLAAGAAAVLTALSRVNEPSITRTVLAFEALWIRRQTWLGPVYWGAREPTLHAKLIAIARRYNDLLTPEPGLAPPTPDFAVAALSEELKDAQDRTALRMLVSALGLLPMGTVVQLATGEVAEVIRGPKGPGEKPRVVLLTDQHGQQLQPLEIELAQDPHRQVVRVLSVDGWRKGLEPGLEGEPYDADRDSRPPAPAAAVTAAPPPQGALPPISPLAPVAMPPPGATSHAHATSRSIADQYADQYAAWSGDEAEPPQRQDPSGSDSIPSGEHNSSASLPSMGSSPSAVAEAMGRMINDSLRPPSAGGAARHERTAPPQASTAGGQTERPANRAAPERDRREPTARGNLAATPLPHVLVYMLDHSLTGTVVFEGDDGGDDALYFVGGVPTKIRLRDEVALLGQMLVHGGAIETPAVEEAVEGARRLGILLGEYLVGHDLVSRDALLWALEAQLLNKVAYLANLAPEISYSYYREVDLLEGWGGGDVPVGCALNPILASVRNWMDRARVRATLNRIGKHPLVLNDDSDLASLALLPEEETTLDVIRAESLPLAQLFKRDVADEEVVSSLVYTLAVTRQFAFKGQKKGPMAAKNGQPWRAESAISSAPHPSGSIPIMAVESGSMPASSGVLAATVPPPASPRRHAAGAFGAAAGAHSAPPAVASPGSQSSPAARPASRRLPAAAPIPSASSASPRSMAPAARPPGSGLPRATAPQIRPITAKKKATIVGMQPAATPEQRQAAARQAAAAQPSGAGRGAPAASPSVSTPPDDMKTVARPSPAFSNMARARMPGPVPLPSAQRPSPGLPSKMARPGAASPAHQTRPAPTAGAGRSGPGPQGASKPAAAAPPRNDALDNDEIEIAIDTGGAPPNRHAIDIGDDGLADAEAALEAMQSFRLAEAALQRSDVAGAQRLAEKAVQGDPSQADYLTLLAWIRALGGDPQAIHDAIATMTHVLGDDPSCEKALLYRGKLLVRMHRFDEAMADFSELLDANPQHREAQAEVRQLRART